MGLVPPFGVPLHAKGKVLCAFDPHAFHQPVGRQRLRHQGLRQPLEALAVQRIDLRSRAAGPLRERATRCQQHVMPQGELHRQVLVVGLAVVHQSGFGMNLLVQAAAQGHVHFL